LSFFILFFRGTPTQSVHVRLFCELDLWRLPLNSFKFVFFTFILSISSFSYSSFAGNEGGVSGGGGNAFVCSDESGHITSVELVDLYEGRLGKDVKYLPLSGNMDEDFQFLAKRIHPDNLKAQDNMLFEYEQLKSHFIDLPADAELYETNDVMLTFKPKNCKLQPIVNFFARNRILIDRELYNRLDYRNQLALHLHEVLYLHEREGGIKDSRYARQIVAAAMQDDEFHHIRLSWINDAEYVCRTSDTDKKTEFYVSKKVTNEYSPVLPMYNFFFTYLNGHKILSYSGFQLLKYSAKKRKTLNPFKDKVFDLQFSIEYPDEYNFLNTNLDIQLKNMNGRGYMKFEGEESDSFDWSGITCTKSMWLSTQLNNYL
jgi:hypothetical protein